MSIQRISDASHEEFTPPAGVTVYDTHHNHMPGPYHEISWHEWVNRSTIWSPRWREFRQAKGMPGFSSITLPSVRIEWYWFGGLASIGPRFWRIATEQDAIDNPLVEVGSTFYTERERFFYVGCPHKWRRMTDQELGARGWHKISRSDNIEVCVDCGMPHRYDSSG